MLKETLQRVLNEAHEGHVYVSDKTQYKRNEHWTINLVGDCEDFALWCRQKLRESDIDSDLILCKVETGEGHLVLHVEGWILDNRHKWVQNRDDLPYEWLSLGRPDGIWYEITG